MSKRPAVTTAALVSALAIGIACFSPMRTHAQSSNRVFEIRTYTAPEGKLDALKARFRDHTIEIFNRHGMTSIGYWVPQGSQNTLIYILAHPSKEVAMQHWREFASDPEWKKVAAESEANGKIVEKIDRVWADPTDFSPLK